MYKNNAYKKRNTTKHIAHCIPFVLGYPDSNQKRQDQNLQCYHYTIPQSFAIYLTGRQLKNLNLLGYPDSNQKRQDQNLQCYHYTIPQCLKLTGVFCHFLNTAAKLRLSIELSKFSVHFFQKKSIISCSSGSFLRIVRLFAGCQTTFRGQTA